MMTAINLNYDDALKIANGKTGWRMMGYNEIESYFLQGRKGLEPGKQYWVDDKNKMSINTMMRLKEPGGSSWKFVYMVNKKTEIQNGIFVRYKA